MRIAIIGPGGMGGGIGRLLARAGHDVIFSGSRNPEKLAHAAELAGPNAPPAFPTPSLQQRSWSSPCRSSGIRTPPGGPAR